MHNFFSVETGSILSLVQPRVKSTSECALVLLYNRISRNEREKKINKIKRNESIETSMSHSNGLVNHHRLYYKYVN